MPRFVNVQLLNQNQTRSYPLADHGSALDKTGEFKIPDDFIVELYFPVHLVSDLDPQKFFVREVLVDAGGFNVAIGYDDGSTSSTSNGVLVATASISKSLHTENTQYVLNGIGVFEDNTGIIAIGKLEAISAASPGRYYFTSESTPLEAGVIWPTVRAISSLTISNGQDVSERFYGHIELVAGTNTRLTSTTTGGVTTITISAISGEGLNASCECSENADKTPIRFINGIPPLADGNFRFVGKDCVDVNPIANGLEFVNTCSKPCCGCDELTAITDQLQRFADGRITLQTFVTSLNAAITQIRDTLLGSRIGDTGCIEC